MGVRVLVCCYKLKAVRNNKLENLQQHSSSLGAALKIPKKIIIGSSCFSQILSS